MFKFISVVKPRQNIQQFQVAVVLPQNFSQGPQLPNPAAPGFVWVQVPVSPPPNQPIPGVVQPPNTPSPAVPKPPINSNPLPDNLSEKCQKPRGQFPSESCNKYINCWDGVAVEQFCPEGLLFSPNGYCDYPGNVNCGGRPIEGRWVLLSFKNNCLLIQEYLLKIQVKPQLQLLQL